MTRWYFNKDRKPIGPITFEEFRKLINAGELKGHQLVNKEGTTLWKKAVEFQELVGLFSEVGVTSVTSSITLVDNNKNEVSSLEQKNLEHQKIELQQPEMQKGEAEKYSSSSITSSRDAKVLGEQTKTETTDYQNEKTVIMEQTEVLQKPDLSAFKESWIVLIKTQESGKNKFLQEGPYSTDQVKSRLLKKEISYKDHIWKNGFEQWKMIAEIDLFAVSELKVTESAVKSLSNLVEKPVLDEEPLLEFNKTQKKVAIPLEQPLENTSTKSRINISAQTQYRDEEKSILVDLKLAKDKEITEKNKTEESKLDERRLKDRREIQRRQKIAEKEEKTEDIFVLKKMFWQFSPAQWVIAIALIVGLGVFFSQGKTYLSKINTYSADNSSETIEELITKQSEEVSVTPSRVAEAVSPAKEIAAQEMGAKANKLEEQAPVKTVESEVNQPPTSFKIDIKTADIGSAKISIIGPMLQGEVVRLKVVGRFGDIQDYPNYYYENKFSFAKNYSLNISLNSLKLKSGFYTFSLANKDKVLLQKKQFVGEYNPTFIEEMKSIKKLLSLNFQLEKKSLVKTVLKIEKHMKSFSQFNAKTKPNDKNWLAWKKSFLVMIPEEVRAINSNFYTLAFPEEWKKLATLIEKMKNYFALQTAANKRMPSSKENTYRAINNELFLLKKEITQLSIN